MQGYLIIAGMAHALDVERDPAGGYRLPDAGPIALIPGTGGGPAHAQVGDKRYAVEVAVTEDRVWIHLDGQAHEIVWRSAVDHYAGEAAATDDGGVRAPMPGAVVSVLAQPRDQVSAGDAVMIIESMKLETTLRAPRDGVVHTVNVAVGETFERDAVLVELAAGEVNP
jgi:acetyl/propionyl-CoA carboxylase alpha subunit